MEVIKLDGATLCYMHRDKDGIHIEMVEDKTKEIKIGDFKQIPLLECPSDCNYRVDISNKTYVAFVKSLLSYADRSELVNILIKPIDNSCWVEGKLKTITR